MRKLALFLSVVAIVACDRSKPALEKALAQAQQVSAEKDSLLRDVTATSQFLAEMSTAIMKVRSLNAATPELTRAGDAAAMPSRDAQRTQLLAQVKAITARLNENETRLAASRKRVADLTGSNADMAKQLASYDSTVAAFRTMIDNQKAELASIQAQVTALTTENTQLKTDNTQLVTEKTALTGERDQLTTEKNTVYYVVGTREDLLKKHVIVQTGGVLGLGKTAIPSRDLNPAEFTSIDKTQVSEIPLPKPGRAYRIVSTQTVAALDSAPDPKGRITGAVKIKDPNAFWAPSKFLIVIEQ